MEKTKFKTIFSSTLKSLVPEERDKYLALASMEEIGKFIPDIDTETNIDLLPIAFNAAVANRVNKNGDVINTSTALDIYKNFINKPINIEHNREKVIGVILSASFSEFGTDNLIEEEDVKGTNAPFNITLGGVAWKLVNRSLTDAIETASDPTSENYMKVSASWELGFSEYNIVILEAGEKNIENGTIIDDPEEIEKLEEKLAGMGGDGKTKDGKRMYRQVINEVVPLGIGLTESPAADVEGVATKSGEKIEINVNFEKPANIEEDAGRISSEEEAVDSEDESKTVQIKSSQNKQKVVKQERKKLMKINSLEDINEESMKELSASAVSEFIREELEHASEKWSEDKSATDKALTESKEQHEQLIKEHDQVKEELSELNDKLGELEQQAAERKAQETFVQRMSSLDEVYKLNDDDRKVLAKQIKDLDDESFVAYEETLIVLLKEKNKEILKAKVENSQKEIEEEVSASASEEEVAKTVEEVVDNAESVEEAVVNTTETEEPTILDKYEKAFALDQFEIKL